MGSGSDYLKKPRRVRRSAANKVKIIFGRGTYVDKNTSQTASVEFVCLWQTNYARSGLPRLAEKPEGIFRQAQPEHLGVPALEAYS